jgi:hypothetical protein
MLEELAEGVIKSVLRIIGIVVRCLIWLALELFFEGVLWYIGWLVCRVISFGQYPSEKINNHDQASGFTQIFVPLIGLAALLAVAIVIAKLTGYG